VAHEHRATQNVRPKVVNKRVHRFITLMEGVSMAQYYQQKEGFTRKKGSDIFATALHLVHLIT
jgi:hypothetical protein